MDKIILGIIPNKRAKVLLRNVRGYAREGLVCKRGAASKKRKGAGDAIWTEPSVR